MLIATIAIVLLLISVWTLVALLLLAHSKIKKLEEPKTEVLFWVNLGSPDFETLNAIHLVDDQGNLFRYPRNAVVITEDDYDEGRRLGPFRVTVPAPPQVWLPREAIPRDALRPLP